MNEDLLKALPYIKPRVDGATPTMEISFDNQPVMASLYNGLLVAYLVDKGDRFQYIQNRDLKVAGWTQPQLHQQSMNNLGSHMAANLRIEQHGPVFIVFAGGNFESSLLLMDDVWSQLEQDMPNGTVVAVPARDVVAFCDLKSQEGISKLKNVVARAENLDHPITKSLLRREKSAWVLYEDVWH